MAHRQRWHETQTLCSGKVRSLEGLAPTTSPARQLFHHDAQHKGSCDGDHDRRLVVTVAGNPPSALG
jgi:hypothetical protein